MAGNVEYRIYNDWTTREINHFVANFVASHKDYGTKSNFNRKARSFIRTYYGSLYFNSRLYLDVYSSLESYLSSDRLRRVSYC